MKMKDPIGLALIGAIALFIAGVVWFALAYEYQCRDGVPTYGRCGNDKRLVVIDGAVICQCEEKAP